MGSHLAVKSRSASALAAAWLTEHCEQCDEEWKKTFCNVVGYLVTGVWPKIGRPTFKEKQVVEQIIRLKRLTDIGNLSFHEACHYCQERCSGFECHLE